MSDATLDTSIWIPYLRSGRYASTVDTLLANGQVYLPSIVLLELYAGTTSVGHKRALDTIASAAQALGRLFHPSAEDLCLAGQILAYYAQRHGHVRPRDHSHDLLIAMGAGRTGSVLLTENLGDMRRWADALRRRARLRVRVVRLTA